MPLLPSHTLLQAYTLTLIGSSYLLLFSPLSLLNASPLWLLGESMHIRRASFVPATPGLGNNPSTSAPGVTLHGRKSLVESVLGGGSVLLSNDVREVLAILGFVIFLAAVTQGVLASPLRYSKETLVALAVKSGRSANKRGMYSEADAGDVSEFAEKIHTLHTTQTLFLTVSAIRVVVEGGLVAYIYLLYADRSHKLGREIVVEMDGKGMGGIMGLLANRIVFAVGMADMLFWGYIWTVLREEAREVAEVLGRRRAMEQEEEERL